MSQIVECVPNFSEGRRQDVIDQIVAAIEQASSARVLDVQSDIDHNRSVVTLIGRPEEVVESAYAGIAAAAVLIDMNHHRGGHPRMGATDVVPFVPVRDMTMHDCTILARELGQRVGSDLELPVYLYEAAATVPERKNLAYVRRGEYEGLLETISSDASRAPDFGPAVLGPAGAIAIGARPALIAFNVYLNSADVNIARAIARSVRYSSGGLRYVKAMGLLVEGHAQVSMNLTDYRKTPIHRVLDLIRSEAASFGVGVARSEVVGLLPAEALLDSAQHYLQLHGFSLEQILDDHLDKPA